MKRKLGEVCQFYSGTGFPTKYQGKDNDELAFYKVGDIANNVALGNIYLRECGNYISRSEATEIKGSVLPRDTVVFAKIGEALKLNRRAITSAECLIDNNAMGISPQKEVLRIGYFYYFMKNVKMQNLAESTTVPSVRKSRLEELEIEVPSVAEQEVIEEKLDKASTIIRERTRELTVLDSLIKARFVEMFGEPFSRPLWPVKVIDDIAISIMDGSNVDKKLYRQQGDVLFLRIQNVWRNEFRLDDSVYISSEDNHSYADTSLHYGDLLMTKIGRHYTKDSSLGRVSVYLGEDNKANYSNNIMRIRFNDEVLSEFVNALLNLDDYQEYIKKTSLGGTDKRALSKKLIGSYPIIIPSRDMQENFVEFVHQVDKSRFAVQKALDETKVLFDSLMQEYFG